MLVLFLAWSPGRQQHGQEGTTWSGRGSLIKVHRGVFQNRTLAKASQRQLGVECGLFHTPLDLT